jgi:hypothetical protein
VLLLGDTIQPLRTTQLSLSLISTMSKQLGIHKEIQISDSLPELVGWSLEEAVPFCGAHSMSLPTQLPPAWALKTLEYSLILP